jgi:hypothetical protein
MRRQGKIEDEIHGFFRPFYRTGMGHIFTLSAPNDHMRDGLAATQISRCFPLPQYPRIKVEPSRPDIQPSENIILVGSAALFIEPQAHPTAGKRPLSVGYPRLGKRIERIQEQCCYQFKGGKRAAFVNRETGESYVPEAKDEQGAEVDYGVIRRVFRGPKENTVVLEGLHRLGTLGVAQVVTTPGLLSAIWDAVRKIESFDDSLPLEILVRTTFHPDLSSGVYAFEAINATPLTIVLNRQWVYDLNEDRQWRDQGPWDVSLLVKGDDPAARVAGATFNPPVPRLEVQANLKDLDPRIQAACRGLPSDMDAISTPVDRRRRKREAGRLLEALTRESDRFRMDLVETTPIGGRVKETRLPQRPSPPRRRRKKYLVHLILCRILGTSFRCDEASLKKFFPEVVREAGRRDPMKLFTKSVSGKLREGFRPLFERMRKPTDYLQIEYSRKAGTYELRLDELALVVRMRLSPSSRTRQ